MSIRLSLLTLACAGILSAQTNPATQHKAKAKTDAQFMDNAIAATLWGGKIAGPGIQAQETKTLPSGVAITDTGASLAMTGWVTSTNATTGANITMDSVTWNGGAWILNDHTAGVETRPLDDKGPTLDQVEYAALNLDQAKLAPASYLQLAKAVQLESPSTDEAQMLQAIYDHHFRVYDFDKVDNYLYRQALKQGTRVRWVWKPMREADLKVAQNAGFVPQNQGIVFAKQYGQRIPARILEDAKCVLGDVKDVVFLVSDYEVVKPDPFLAITTPKLLAQGKLWIIDRWDEPGFDDGKGKTGGEGGGNIRRDVVSNQPISIVAALQ